MGFKLAVVGATGNVGREILTILAEREFPADDVIALASSRSIGREVSFGEEDTLKVQGLDTYDFRGTDIVLSSPGAKISAEFALKKGSTPVVLNAPTENLDECNKIVLETLKDPARQKPNPHNTADADWFNATWDVVDRYWNDPKMTSDQAIAELKKAHDSIF